MRIALIAAGTCLVAAFAAPRPTAPADARLKDRAAMIIYDGRDRVIAFVPSADSANLALILLNLQGDTVTSTQLANRPCIGIALFSKLEWAGLTANGRRPSDVRPSEATMRLRVYPATKDARAAVQDIREGSAYVAVGLEIDQDSRAKAPFVWPVKTYAEKAQGRCTAE